MQNCKFKVLIGNGSNRLDLVLDYDHYRDLPFDLFIELGLFVAVYKICEDGEIQNPE